MSTNALVVLSTFPTADKAAEVARTLVEERLVACVNLVPAIRSIYRWVDADGVAAICDEPEVLAVMKTTQERYPALAARVCELHPYQVPELVALSPSAGHAPYLAWIADALGRRR